MDDPLYMMFPVWFFTFKYEDKPYTILINGQSGKVVGTMPWVSKRIKTIAVLTFVITLVLFIVSFLGILFGNEGFQGFFNAIIIFLMTFATTVFVRSIVGIKRIKANLKLTQSEDIFKYVKKRQG